MAPQCVPEIPAPSPEVYLGSSFSITLQNSIFPFPSFSSVNSSQSQPISPLEYDKIPQPCLSAPLHVNPSLSYLFSQ